MKKLDRILIIDLWHAAKPCPAMSDYKMRAKQMCNFVSQKMRLTEFNCDAPK